MTSLVKKLAMTTALFAAPMLVATQALAEGERYVLVSHAPDSDSCWNTVKNGIKLAGDQMGVAVEHTNPPSGDIADMVRLIDQAAASKPDGIITTLADFDVLKGPFRVAVDQGIDVIIMNTGTPE